MLVGRVGRIGESGSQVDTAHELSGPAYAFFCRIQWSPFPSIPWNQPSLVHIPPPGVLKVVERRCQPAADDDDELETVGELRRRSTATTGAGEQPSRGRGGPYRVEVGRV